MRDLPRMVLGCDLQPGMTIRRGYSTYHITRLEPAGGHQVLGHTLPPGTRHAFDGDGPIGVYLAPDLAYAVIATERRPLYKERLVHDLPYDHPDRVTPEQLRLPDFEGEPIRRATMKLTGAIDGYVGAHARRKHVYLVVEAEIAKVTHADADGVAVREHNAKIVEAYFVPDDLGPAELFDQARELAATLASLAEQVDGQQQLGDGGEP